MHFPARVAVSAVALGLAVLGLAATVIVAIAPSAGAGTARPGAPTPAVLYVNGLAMSRLTSQSTSATAAERGKSRPTR